MTLFDRTFVSDNWIANGYFAAKSNNKVLTNFNKLNDYVTEVENSEQFKAKLVGKRDIDNLPYLVFEYKETQPNWQYFINKEVFINPVYINIISDSHPRKYRYGYSPSQNVILVYDRNDCLIGFVKEIVFDES